MAVDSFSTDKEIRRGLEWVAARANYRALLRCFIEDEFSSHGASEQGSAGLLLCQANAESGAVVSASSFRNIASVSARSALSTWLMNALRKDLGLMPEVDGRIITCYCDDASRKPITRTFEALGYKDLEALTWLRELSKKHRFSTWSEFGAFIAQIRLLQSGYARR